MNIPTLLFLVGLAWASSSEALKTADAKDKRGVVSGTYSSPPSSYGPPQEHNIGGSGFTPIAPSYGHNTASLGALLIPGNLLYGQGLDYSALSYGGYGGLGSVPSSYPIGLNLGGVSSPSVSAYKLGPVTFNPGPASPYGASSPLVGSSYPGYNLVSPVTPEYAIGSAYAVPSYPSSLGYSPSYASVGSAYSSYPSPGSSYPSPGSSYPSSSSSYPSSGSSYSSYSSPSSSYSSYPSTGSSYSSYQSPGLGSYASSPNSSSPPYSAFVSSSSGSAHHSSYSPSASYSSSSAHSPSGSSYSSYSGPSSSYPSPVYGPPSYKGSSGIYSKY